MTKNIEKHSPLNLIEAIQENLVLLNQSCEQLNLLKKLLSHFFDDDNWEEKQIITSLIKEKEQQITRLFTELPTK